MPAIDQSIKSGTSLSLGEGWGEAQYRIIKHPSLKYDLTSTSTQDPIKRWFELLKTRKAIPL